MNILHIAGGGDVGGAKTHILNLVHELGRSATVKIASLRAGPFADEALAMGIDAEVIKSGNFFKDISKLRRIIQDGKYDIIHSHGAKANMYSVIAAGKTGIPLVTTVHSDYKLDYLHNVLKRLSFGIINSIALRFLDYHIAVSQNFREMLIRRRFNPENIFTLYNGIDYSKFKGDFDRDVFAKKYSLNIKKGDIVIGLLGRLHPVKGQDTLINAAQIVTARFPGVKFVLGGEGNYRRSLEKKIRARGLTGNFFLPGWINDPYEFMSCIDINVLTSISETFPYVIMEGAMYKRATVSTSVGGISDLIKSGENGFLFKPGDAKTLASHLIRLVEDPALRISFGAALRKKAEAEFSLETMYSTQVDIYSSIIAGKMAGMTRRKDFDAMISGYYGFRNIGDDAMLQSIINDLRKNRKNVRMLVLSRVPVESGLNFNVNSIGRYNLPRILLSMRRTKLLIYGGGTLIQETTSTRSLIYYLGTIWIAKRMGLRVMLYANGIEPMSRRMNRRLTSGILNQVDVITLREESSLLELSNLGIKSPRIILTADAALSFNAPAPSSDEEIEQILKMECIPADKPIIGISVRKWPGLPQYAPVIARVADYISSQIGAIPLFIAMQYPDDLTATAEVTALMKEKAYVVKSGLNAPQTLGLIKKMQILIGMRLHALVFAAETGIPIIGIPYTHKVQSFLQYIGQSRFSSGDMSSSDAARLKDLFIEIWENRDAVSASLMESMPLLRAKASENARIAAALIADAPKKT